MLTKPDQELLQEKEENLPLQNTCKNCSTTFSGKFCPQCGQSIKEFERPLRLLLIDFAGNLIAFDTRLWRSLSHVLLRPGKMESEYLLGRRIRYMPPFRLYIFMSFVFFLLLTTATNISIRKNNGQNKADLSLQTGRIFFGSEVPADHPAKQFHDSIVRQVKAPAPVISSEKKKTNTFNIKTAEIIQNPQYFLGRFFKYFSWALFILMPIYGFLLWMMFGKARKYFLSHFLLSVNQHVVLFTLLILLLSISLILPQKTASPESWLMLLFPVYVVAGARRVYSLPWIQLILRLSLALYLYFFIAAFTAIAVILIAFT